MSKILHDPPQKLSAPPPSSILNVRSLKLMSSGPGDLFILRFWSFFNTISSANTTVMLLFSLIGSDMSHSVLNYLVKTLLNWFANVLALPKSVSARSFLFAFFHLFKLGVGTLHFFFWFTYFTYFWPGHWYFLFFFDC